MTGRTEIPSYGIKTWQPSKPKQNHKNHIYYIDTLSCHHCGLPLKQHLIPHSNKQRDDEPPLSFSFLKKYLPSDTPRHGQMHNDDVMN